MEELERLGHFDLDVIENRYVLFQEKHFREWCMRVLDWTNVYFENHPMVEVEMAGKICGGMALKGYDWTEMMNGRVTLTCLFYYRDMYEIILDALENVSDNLKECYMVAVEVDKEFHEGVVRCLEYDQRQMDVEPNTWSYGFLETNEAVRDLVDMAKTKHTAIIDSYLSLINTLEHDVCKIYSRMKEHVDMYNMLNQQYEHYYDVEGRGKIQQWNMELQMMSEEERRDYLNSRKKVVTARIGKSRMGSLHNRCCDIYGRNWDDIKFQVSLIWDAYDYEDYFNYMVDMLELRFIDSAIDGKEFDDQEPFLKNDLSSAVSAIRDDVEKMEQEAVKSEDAELIDEKTEGENGEAETGKCEKTTENVKVENGEGEDALEAENETGAEDEEGNIARGFEEMMRNLEEFVRSPYRVEWIVDVVKGELMKRGDERLSAELIKLLRAKDKEHRLGRMSINHFYRLVRLFEDENIVGKKGKQAKEVIRMGLGEHWKKDYEKSFNKCFSNSWKNFAGKKYDHITLELIDKIKDRKG